MVPAGGDGARALLDKNTTDGAADAVHDNEAHWIDPALKRQVIFSCLCCPTDLSLFSQSQLFSIAQV